MWIQSPRSPREGEGNPIQCSYLENSMDRGALWATVRGVTQSRTRLKRLSSREGRWIGSQEWIFPIPFFL